MKPAATLLLMLIVLSIRAQTADSTAILLQRYKDLYTQKLVNATEYQLLKSRLLGIPFDISTNPDSSRAYALQPPYKGRILGGAIMIGAGLGSMLVIGLADALVPAHSPLADDRKEQTAVFLGPGIIGGVTALVGGVVFGLGMREKFIFSRDNLAISITDNNGLGLACKF